MSNVNLFGSSYSPVGSSTSDLLLKSRGKVKIQVGNKFIDLIKDGKINVQSKFIYQQNEVGKLDGIYVVGEDIFLVVDGNQINLNGGQETTYVSFMQPQKVTSEQKQQALINIGFVYPDLSSLEADNILNSIVYVQETQKLYVVINGTIQEYTTPFPSTFTKQFIIEKNNDDKGAIYIKGTGEENGLRFDFMTIYSDGDYITFNCDTSVVYKVLGNNILEISPEGIKSNVAIYCDIIQATNAGFKLYTSSSGSTLEVDNLIVRNQSEQSSNNLYPYYIFGGINIISTTALAPSKTEESLEKITVTLKYKNEYKKDDIICIAIKTVTDEITTITLNEVTVSEVSDQTISFDFAEGKIQTLDGLLTFLKKGIKISPESLDLIVENGVNTKIGNLKDYKVKNAGEEEAVTGQGVYSEQGVFKKAAYSSDYTLEDEDNSSKFASTEWTNKIINNILPIGSIIMFNGAASNIPEGWHICDGTEGTPNLIGSFIKAAATSGETGGETQIQLATDNIPNHTHSVLTSTLTTSSSGAHTHTYTAPVKGSSNNASDKDIMETSSTQDTSSAGEHTHTVNVSQIQLSSVGSGTPLDWEPKYYSLIYIMKIK